MAYQANEVGEEIWNDMITPGFALGTGSAAPALVPFTPVPGMNLYGFSGSNATPDELFALFELPHNYQEGTDLHCHLHWTPNSNVVANVKWQMAWSIAYIDGTFVAGGTLTVVTATSGVNKHIFSEFDPVIPGLDLKIGTILSCRLFRNALDSEDTYTDFAKLLSFGVHYLCDAPGSRFETTK